jgi:hypothetical protein
VVRLQAAQRLFDGRLCISFYLFKMCQKLAFGNHFYAAVFKAIFVNVVIFVDAVSR